MYDQRVADDIAKDAIGEAITDPLLSIHPYSQLSSASCQSDSHSILLTFVNSLTGGSATTEFDAVIAGTGYERQGWKTLLFPPTNAKVAQSCIGDIFPCTLPPSPSSESAHFPSTISAPLTLPAHLFGDSILSDRSSSRDSSHYQPTTAPSTPPSRQGSFPQNHDTPPFTVKENYRLDLPSMALVEGLEVPFEPTVWLQGSNERTHGVSDSLLRFASIPRMALTLQLIHPMSTVCWPFVREKSWREFCPRGQSR